MNLGGQHVYQKQAIFENSVDAYAPAVNKMPIDIVKLLTNNTPIFYTYRHHRLILPSQAVARPLLERVLHNV